MYRDGSSKGLSGSLDFYESKRVKKVLNEKRRNFNEVRRVKFNLITLFPSFFRILSEGGVIQRAIQRGLLSLECFNPRDWSQNKYGSIDDVPYGGGDGMIMMAQPLKEALCFLKQKGNLGSVVYLSPQGQKWSQKKAFEWSQGKQVVTMICGRYGGVDQRFIEKYVDEEISIGDYVLTGGELAAMVVIDSVLRLYPDVLKNKDSSRKDSFQSSLLEAPQFTRPFHFEDFNVPEILLSGHQRKIQVWNFQISLIKTFQKRSDLLERNTEAEKKAIKKELGKALEAASHWSKEDLQSCGIYDLEELKAQFSSL